MSSRILSVPSDVIILVMQYLCARDLASLERTCRSLHALVEEFGWKLYLRMNPRPSHSLQKSFNLWGPRAEVRFNTITDSQWSRAEFVARPLSHRWAGKLQPLLAINSSRLLLAAGNVIYSYGFLPSPHPSEAPSVRLECTYSTSVSGHPNCDITSLVCIPDSGLDRTVCIGYADGTIERVVLPAPRSFKESIVSIDASLRERHDYHGDDLVEGLSANSTHLLSLSSAGTAALQSLRSSESRPQCIDLNCRSWSTYLSSDYAAFGISSVSPLVIHSVRSSTMSHSPHALLAPSGGYDRLSAVYAIEPAPSAAPWGASDKIIVSGWYDGVVRVHDLRSSSRIPTPPSVSTNSSLPPPSTSLLPTLELDDPWSFEPIYSVACGGGSASHIAAGSARHSVLAFWDVRYPKSGWSVHAPGNDPSPVYSVVVDGSRVFGANQSRGFVLDFGDGVQENTYPALGPDHVPDARRGRGSRARADDSLKKAPQGGAGYYVTKYSHRRLKEH